MSNISGRSQTNSRVPILDCQVATILPPPALSRHHHRAPTSRGAASALLRGNQGTNPPDSRLQLHRIESFHCFVLGPAQTHPPVSQGSHTARHPLTSFCKPGTSYGSNPQRKQIGDLFRCATLPIKICRPGRAVVTHVSITCHWGFPGASPGCHVLPLTASLTPLGPTRAQ